jgi:hypothetical protein
MGYQKLQVGRGTDMTNLLSSTEDTVNLNNPIALTSDALTVGTTGVTLVDSSATYITDGVTPGDLVVNTSNIPNASRVVSITSETQITVQTTGKFTSGDLIEIWTQSTEPAVLYVGGAGTIVATTMGGDNITLNGVTAGSFLPIQVKGVSSTSTATGIIALF